MGDKSKKDLGDAQSHKGHSETPKHEPKIARSIYDKPASKPKSADHSTAHTSGEHKSSGAHKPGAEAPKAGASHGKTAADHKTGESHPKSAAEHKTGESHPKSAAEHKGAEAPRTRQSETHPHKPGEHAGGKADLSTYISHLKERASTGVNDEIARLKNSVKTVQDTLHTVEKKAAKVFNEVTTPKVSESKQHTHNEVAANRMTPEQRKQAGAFEYTDPKHHVTYKYDHASGNLRQLEKGNTVTEVAYDKHSGKPSHMEIRQGNHVLASMEKKDATSLQVNQNTGEISVETEHKAPKTHVAKEATTYGADGQVTHIGYDKNSHRTSKVLFALEGDEFTPKSRYDYVYTKGTKEQEGSVFCVGRNLTEKDPAKQVVEKCWFDKPQHVEKNTPAMRVKITRDDFHSTTITRTFKDGRHEELNLDHQGHAVAFKVQDAKGTTRYDVKEGKLVGQDKEATSHAEHDLARMRRLYGVQAKPDKIDKAEEMPGGITEWGRKESKLGTVVVKADDGIHSWTVKHGEVRDQNKQLIGHLDKDGKITFEKNVALTVGNQRIADEVQLSKLEGASFFNAHSESSNLKAIESKDAKGFNGLMLSPDQTQHRLVIENNVFNPDGQFIGHLDKDGKLVTALESGKGKSDVNSEMRDWSFVGQDSGQKRVFVASKDMCDGEIWLGNPPKKHTVQMGMIIDTDSSGNQIQKGVLHAPSLASGKLAGGSVTMFDGPQAGKEQQLHEVQGAVFDLKLKGEGGVESQRIQGASIGKTNENQSGLFDMQEARAKESATRQSADQQVKAREDDTVGYYARKLTGLNSDYQSMKDSQELAHKKYDQRIAAMEEMQRTGQVNADFLKLYEKELGRVNAQPKPAEPEKKENEEKTVIRKPDLAGKKITGAARCGNEIFHFEGSVVTKDGKAIGEISSDYVLHIKGRPPIDLKQEDRVLMQFSIDGAKEEPDAHKLLGLGRTRVGVNGKTYEGGLVYTKALEEEAAKYQKTIEGANQEYFDKRRTMTADLGNMALGDAETLMRDQVGTLLHQRQGLKAEFSSLFKHGFEQDDSKQMTNNRIDQSVRATQHMMDNCRTTTGDSVQLTERTRMLQDQMNEGLVMSASMLATMGVGTVFNGLVNTGRLANLSRGAVWASELSTSTILGGTISAVGRQTDGGDSGEKWRNFGSGMVEGLLNTGGGKTLGKFMQSQKLAQTGIMLEQLAKADIQMSHIANASVKVDQLLKGTTKIEQISSALVKVEELERVGLSAEKLASVGIKAEELQKGALSIERLRQAAIAEKELGKLSITVEHLAKTGIDMQKVPVTLGELQKLGINLSQLSTKGVKLGQGAEQAFTISDQMLMDSKFGKFSVQMLSNPNANALLRHSLRGGEAVVQTMGFNLAAGIRDERGLKLNEVWSPERVLMGTMFNLGAQGLGEMASGASAYARSLGQAETKSRMLDALVKSRSAKGILSDFVAESVEQYVSRLPQEITNVYSNAAMEGIAPAIEKEKQRLQAENPNQKLTEEDLWQRMNFTNVLRDVHESGAMAAATTPFMAAFSSPLHAWSEGGAPIQREHPKIEAAETTSHAEMGQGRAHEGAAPHARANMLDPFESDTISKESALRQSTLAIANESHPEHQAGNDARIAMRTSKDIYLAKSPARFKSEHERDVLLFRHLKVDENPTFQDNVMRKFIRTAQEATRWEPIDMMLPAEQIKQEVERRRASLEQQIGERFTELGAPRPRIEVVPDAQMGDANAAYIKGQGIVQIRESRFWGIDHFQVDELGHESLGHLVQDHLVQSTSILDALRQGKAANVSHLVKEVVHEDGSHGLELTAKGKLLCEQIAKEDTKRSKSLDGTNKEFVESCLLSSTKWLNERLKMSDQALTNDAQYMRGKKLKDSFQAPKEHGSQQSQSLFNLLENRALNHKEDPEIFAQKLVHLLKEAPNAELPQGFDAKVVLDRMLDKNNYEELFAHKARKEQSNPLEQYSTPVKDGKGNELSPRADGLFDRLLQNSDFHSSHPDFLTRLVECNMEANPQHRAELRQQWLDMIKAANPEHPEAAPSTPQMIARFDLKAYQFLRDHFENGGGPVGHLTREAFEEKLPYLVRTLVKDSINVAETRELLRYRANYYELEPHYIHFRMRQLLRNNDLAHRTEEDRPQHRSQRQQAYAKVFHTLKERAGAKAHDEQVADVSATAKRAPIKLFSKHGADDHNEESGADLFSNMLAKMARDRARQEAHELHEEEFSLKESSLIPDGYMPSAKDKQGKHDEKGGKEGDDDTGGGGGSDRDKDKKKLFDRTGGRKGNRQSMGDASDLSGDELADMPQKKNDAQVGDAKQNQTPVNWEEVQRLEAERQRRNRLWSKQNPTDTQQVDVPKLVAAIKSAPPDLQTHLQGMANPSKLRVLADILGTYDAHQLPPKVESAIKDQANLSSDQIRAVFNSERATALGTLDKALLAATDAHLFSDKAFSNRAWKTAVDGFNQIDAYERRSPAEEAKYKVLRAKLEEEVRHRVSDLANYLTTPPDQKGKSEGSVDALNLDSRYRATSSKVGIAQQEQYCRLLSLGINGKVLSDESIAAKPEVLANNKELSTLLRKEMAAELSAAEGRYLSRGMKKDQAEHQALLDTIKKLEQGMSQKDFDQYNPLEEMIEQTKEAAQERGRDWIGLPIAEGCMLDQLGCDYLLVNKRTGEMIPLDVTVKGDNKSNRLVDCQALNPDLNWHPPYDELDTTGKHVPRDRTRFVMVVGDELEWRNAVSARMNRLGCDESTALKGVQAETIESAATALLATMQEKSRLNIFEHDLPPANINLPRTHRADPARQFVRNLRSIGMSSWALDLEQRYIQGHLKSTP